MEYIIRLFGNGLSTKGTCGRIGKFICLLRVSLWNMKKKLSFPWRSGSVMEAGSWGIYAASRLSGCKGEESGNGGWGDWVGGVVRCL